MGRYPVVLLATVVWWLAAPATTFAKSPFTDHLRDAIRLNKQRAPRYTMLTDGRSKKISRRLILLERLAIPVAKLFDWRARKYQRAGVPILAEDLVSMERTPPFAARLSSQPPPLHRFVPADARAIAKRVRRGYGQQKWAGVAQVVEDELEKIRGTGPHHAMLRHMLESVARIAHLAPKHSKLAQDKGMKPTDTFSWRLVQLHLFSLPSFARLDTLAAPLQSQGIPILHRDVPPIPLGSDFYDRPGVSVPPSR